MQSARSTDASVHIPHASTYAASRANQ